MREMSNGRSQAAGRGARWWTGTRPYRPVLLLLIALVIVGGTTQSAFLTWGNIQNLLASQALLWIVAMGMTFVLLSGGLDLSVAAVSTFTGVLLAKLLSAGVPAGVLVVLVVIAGAVIGGVLNGLLIARWNLSPFIVTLASMTALTGVVQLWSNAASFPVNDNFILNLGVNKLAGVQIPIWFMAGAFAVALYAQKWTYFGRDVYAIGGNAIAARLSGIYISRTLVWIYAITGAAAALGGVIAVGRIGAASPQVDPTLPLEAIAAVVLGGTALNGGAGGVVGTALGVLFIGGLENLLSVAGVSQAWQQVFTGVILVVAVRQYRSKRRVVSSDGTSSGAAEPPAEPAQHEVTAVTSTGVCVAPPSVN